MNKHDSGGSKLYLPYLFSLWLTVCAKCFINPHFRDTQKEHLPLCLMVCNAVQHCFNMCRESKPKSFESPNHSHSGVKSSCWLQALEEKINETHSSGLKAAHHLAAWCRRTLRFWPRKQSWSGEDILIVHVPAFQLLNNTKRQLSTAQIFSLCSVACGLGLWVSLEW